MRKHNVKRVRKANVATTAGNVPWRFFVLTILCACILAAGFFYAARQHFSTMDLGLKNSKLRKQIEDLESERRRLILAKEVSLSPIEITKTAQLLGFRDGRGEPQRATLASTRKETVETELKPILASTRESKLPDGPEVKNLESKKLVKPIIQQAPSKPNPINERPRIVAETDKRTASNAMRSTGKTN